jgi:Mce-associated membrane protein
VIRGRSGSRSTLVGLVAAALCVPAAVGVVLLDVRASATTGHNAARHGALAAAARITHDILSYDYRTIDQDIARARAETTGTFARQYAAATAELRTQAVATRAIVQARVRDTGVVTAGSKQVVVLVFADQVSVTRASTRSVPTTRLIPSAVQLTLTDVGGRWRVATLSAVQTGAPGSAAG